MKTTHFLSIILVSLFTTQLISQVNTSVRSALCLPSGVGTLSQTEVINLTSSDNCIAGGVRLYYQFYVGQSSAGPSDAGTWTLTSGTFNYNLYGPFSSLESAYAQVESGTAVPITSSVSASTSHEIDMGGAIALGDVYIIELILNTCATTINLTSLSGKIPTCNPISLTCDDCLGQFLPNQGTYVFSAWTKEVGAEVTKTSYTYPGIEIETYDGSTTDITPLAPVGDIIDGWQQITGTFDIPPNMLAFKLRFLVGGSGETALFDDIRIFPFDGSMMSYVYDPINLRLVAELDERNYAKLYEYDEEGKLVRVKKETEKGVMTIMENRENSVKKP
ncbi:MAG TPA: hypothetical protein VK151_00045 [Fluviicola sp.]|nr:hypothetical protein [Fluviicola sp.]